MGVIYKNRTTHKITDDLIKITSACETSAKSIIRDVTGNFFRLIFLKITNGKVYWNRDNDYFYPSTNNFGVYIPEFSISEDIHEHSQFEGYMYVGRMEKQPVSRPVMFPVSRWENFKSVDEIYHYLEQDHEFHNISRCTTPHKISSDCKKIIAAHYLDNIQISEVSKRLKVHNAMMARYFKKDFGISPVQYRRALRTENALYLLASGVTPAEAAFMSGYNDLGRFYKQFGDVFYQPPGSIKKG